jgi:hypothetical protein
MSQPIIPPNQGLTEEAVQHLAEQGILTDPADTDLAGIADEFHEEPFPFAAMQDLGAEDIGEVIEAEIVDESEGQKQEAPKTGGRSRSRSRATPKDAKSPRDAKAGPPSLDEWQNFFSRVVLRLVTEWYVNYAFRGIDEDTLSDKELDRLAMSDDERQMIAVPFAELSHKSKLMRRYGRTIVASGDAVNSLVVLAAWASRVNRIASKHRPRVRTVINNGSSGQSTTEATSPTTSGANGGRIPDGFYGPIFPTGSG